MRNALAGVVWTLVSVSVCAQEPAPDRDQMLRSAVRLLVQIQEPDGAWPYEGVYRVNREIPVGYRVGGTALVAGSLLAAAPNDRAAREAVSRGLTLVLKELDHPLMAASRQNTYDVRVWGQACALEFLCHVRAAKAVGAHRASIDAWIDKLAGILVTEEIDGGGWNYASRQRPASFVTAPIVQALLLAQSQGVKVPDAVFQRAKEALERSRTEEAAFTYSGSASARVSAGDKPAGSAARSAVCETTLLLLNAGSVERIRGAIGAFHTHWDELKKRHQQTGTHVPPYMIAPYYFFYGHRYAAQAIEFLPVAERMNERDKLLKVILRTREADGGWNDRVFAHSKAYGTAMIVLALLGEKAPAPPRWQPAKPDSK